MPLIRRILEPLAAVSKKEEQGEDVVFLRLQDLARDQSNVYSCAVQSTDSEFVVILSDLDSGKEMCAWSGSADAVVVEFQHWLERKAVERARA